MFVCGGSNTSVSVSDSRVGFDGRADVVCPWCGRCFNVKAKYDRQGWPYLPIPRHGKEES